MKKLLSLTLFFVFVLALVACSELPEETTAESPYAASSVAEDTSVSEKTGDLWTDAVYTEDASVGSGEKIVYINVVTPEKSLKLTLATDETVLGDALIKSGIVEGEEGPYGLYIRKVNGISAVYETDGAYWSLSVNGEAAATGADGIDLEDGMTYELIYTTD